jgi:hypothetical protein
MKLVAALRSVLLGSRFKLFSRPFFCKNSALENKLVTPREADPF